MNPVRLSIALAVAAAFGVLALALPARGFFSGDAGVKLIAARNTQAHPRRAFEIDLPRIDGRAVTAVDPMIVPHDDHAHVLQSPVFPVITSPLLGAFGLRGVYLLPALSFIAIVPLMESIRRRIDSQAGRGVMLALVTTAASPLFFYGLEFWEHAPAVALLAGVTALVVHDRFDVLAGVVGGAAVLLRPESAWYLAAVALVTSPRRWPALAIGGALVLAPLSFASYLHSGSFLGPHLTATLSPLETDWVGARWQRVQAWFWPDSTAEAVGMLLLAVGWVLHRASGGLKASGYQPTEVKASGNQLTRVNASGYLQVVPLLGAAVIGVLAASRGLQRDSIWQVFPVAALALVPTGRPAGRERRGSEGRPPHDSEHLRGLRIVATVTIVGIVLTATHDGGAQWGPRFLLVASVPLMLLAARSAVDALRPGPVRALRIGLVIIVLLAGVSTSRAAYVEIRNAKRAYARIVDATAANSVAGGYIVTNVWWLDQVAAPLYGTRTFLYAADEPSARQLTEEVAAGGHPVTLVWSGEEGTAPLDVALGGTCYEEMSRRTIVERQLTFVTSRCTADRRRPPAAPR